MASRHRTTEQNTIENYRYYSKRKSNSIDIKKRYTEIENILIKQHLITDTQLGILINRSVVAIQIQRCKLKKKII